MTHTRSALKLSLTQCQNMRTGCDGCEYRVLNPSRCIRDLNRDALEYIMELETEIKQLKEVPHNGNA